MDNIFLYLLGFAGTGKLTIARAFARSVGAKVVDNHWINNPIFGLIDPDGVSPLPDAVWSQTAKVREAVLETIVSRAGKASRELRIHARWHRRRALRRRRVARHPINSGTPRRPAHPRPLGVQRG